MFERFPGSGKEERAQGNYVRTEVIDVPLFTLCGGVDLTALPGLGP